MSNVTEVASSTESSVAAAKAKASEAQAKVKANEARQAQADASAIAFQAKVHALIKEGSELQADTMDAIARLLGKSANSKGQPTESGYITYLCTIAHRKLTYERRRDLMVKANAVCADNAKPVAKVTAKARSDKGRQEFTLNQPGLVSENIGNES